ncbi:F-box only protein 3 [Dissostichus eleginoides]|uniref:F-box only protein 3 n=1 Tax=Dissostichus eleginoides TaxID=100907 RepID=A0AAD9B2R7_DISEL|nr:F-box only protein 3 [Dissostichus eleginoides]
MAANSDLRMDLLPSDPLLHILSFLSFRDLIHCSFVSRRLNELSKHNPLWKRLSSKHWLLTDVERLQSGVSWYLLFQQNYRDLGGYLQHYAPLKRSWEQLKGFLLLKCPRMIASLKEGATETELNDIEADGQHADGQHVSDCLSVSLRLMGSMLMGSMLMGSMSLIVSLCPSQDDGQHADGQHADGQHVSDCLSVFVPLRLMGSMSLIVSLCPSQADGQHADGQHVSDCLSVFVPLRLMGSMSLIDDGQHVSDCLSLSLFVPLRLMGSMLMGSMSLSNHYRSEVLLDVETAAGGFQQRKGMRRCLPLTFCFHTGLSQYMALQPAEGRRKFESFYPCPDQLAQDPSAIDMFITGSCFLEWFTAYVHNVVTGEFPIIRDQIFRYVHDKSCVATTGEITVSVSTSFLPELSSVHPPHFFFTYRIRIEMSSSASPDASCQLDSRYWKITMSDGHVEEVQGPGVVGKVHEYASCTTFSTPSEYMEGHYSFHRLADKEDVFHVMIPRFHMVCPPFREPVIRTQKASSRRLEDPDGDGEFCDGDGDDFGDLRGINMAALEGAWCPRHI